MEFAAGAGAGSADSAGWERVPTSAWERESTQFDLLSTSRLMASRTVRVRRSPSKSCLASAGLLATETGEDVWDVGHMVGYLAADGFVLEDADGDDSAVPLVVHASVLQGVGACGCILWCLREGGGGVGALCGGGVGRGGGGAGGGDCVWWAWVLAVVGAHD